MAAITGDFPPGPYQVTFNGTSVGLMEGPIREQRNIIALPIYATVWGRHVIDYIMQGGGVFVVMVLKEWNAGSKAAIWPYHASQGNYPVVGELLNPYFKALVLTALAGTPAATEGPVTRTYALSALLPGHNTDITFGPGERNVPLVLGVLPQQSASDVGRAVYYVDT